MTGSGGYADNRSGASSTTGHGEAFMKTCLAKHMAVLMEQGWLKNCYVIFLCISVRRCTAKYAAASCVPLSQSHETRIALLTIRK